MPLTSHLKYWKQSPIGQFLREKFSQTASITKEANRQLRSASTILPADPALFSGRYGTLGMAIDYRIRYYFALTPSERFFYPGAAASSLAFRPWTNDTDIPVDLGEIPDMMGIFDFDVLITGIAQSFYDWKIFSSFFQALDAMLVKALLWVGG